MSTCDTTRVVSQKEGDGPPKWMVVYNGKPYQTWDDLGGKIPIFGNTHKNTEVPENGWLEDVCLSFWDSVTFHGSISNFTTWWLNQRI